jgi:hypothetical protein
MTGHEDLIRAFAILFLGRSTPRLQDLGGSDRTSPAQRK